MRIEKRGGDWNELSVGIGFGELIVYDTGTIPEFEVDTRNLIKSVSDVFREKFK